MAITLQESLRAIFYAPFYAALARNAFAAEDVEIVFVSSPRPQDAARRLMDGTVDVCWGGPMRVMDTYQHVPGCDIVCFAEVVTRDPFLLVGRSPRPGFVLADLEGLTLASVSEVPTPWLCLQHDLRLAGIDPASIRRVADRTMADNVAALRAGAVDVVQVFEPFPSLLLAEGAGHIWYEAARRGPTSYTTFYARRGLLAAHRVALPALEGNPQHPLVIGDTQCRTEGDHPVNRYIHHPFSHFVTSSHLPHVLSSASAAANAQQ